MSEHDLLIIDLKRKDTEAGWLRRFDRFYLLATPAWFTWLGWIAILSALRMVEARSGSIWVRLTWGLSEFLVFFYFNALFARLRLVGVPLLKTERAHWTISILLAGALAAVAGVASTRLAEALAFASP